MALWNTLESASSIRNRFHPVSCVRQISRRAGPGCESPFSSFQNHACVTNKLGAAVPIKGSCAGFGGSTLAFEGGVSTFFPACSVLAVVSVVEGASSPQPISTNNDIKYVCNMVFSKQLTVFSLRVHVYKWWFIRLQ